MQNIANDTDKGGSFAEFINKKSSSENRRELNAKQREYERLSKRTAELNALFKRLYEDNVLGRINNEQFCMLSCGYTDEQKSIKKAKDRRCICTACPSAPD